MEATVSGIFPQSTRKVILLDISYPVEGTNPLFLGPGRGLPGGGTEMIINPPVQMNSPNVVDQISIKVYP